MRGKGRLVQYSNHRPRAKCALRTLPLLRSSKHGFLQIKITARCVKISEKYKQQYLKTHAHTRLDRF